MKVTNKVIVVTGAGSGMGRELSIQLVQKGAKVALVDIQEEGLQETASLAGKDQVSLHVVNITDRDTVNQLPAEVIASHGAVDGIINNAGIIQPFVDVKDLDYAVIEQVMNVNFYGTLYMVKAFLPELLKRPEAHIANVSSMGGFIPFPGQTFYSASKAAVKILTEGLYSELKGTTVGVTVIHPGAVNTNIMKNSDVQSPGSATAAEAGSKILSAEKAAAIMIDGIERNKYRVLVGKDATMLDYLYRFNPKMAVDLIVKKMKKM
ncbi:SDR family oxidoreductase [Algoriphagus sp. H41]|uniref:SDR family oxidoreductase n=1 Tax=Algoriphagus oliviformis TaxID=2811231 RepID=A0ABS3C883_9BACT|nr:SDR family oxidoreductase [Algoriphagus oliviformis]MBN7812771.1 SDR family oxidoreductase [Algoriphagus oliviformis]